MATLPERNSDVTQTTRTTLIRAFTLGLAVFAASTHAAAAAQLDARKAYIEGREHLIEERYDDALREFRRVVSEFPDSQEADDAQYYIGYALSELGRADAALDAFTELIERWPDSVRVERARAQRAELLARQKGSATDSDLFREVFDGPGSWSLKRDTAYALARKGNLAASDVLEQAMERESSSRQVELARILAPWVSDPTARRILILGLSDGRSSTVKLRVLESLQHVSDEPDVAEAIGRVLANGSSSTVKQKAVHTLAGHVDSERSRSALARALDADNSSSVQMLACRALTGPFARARGQAERRTAVSRLDVLVRSDPMPSEPRARDRQCSCSRCAERGALEPGGVQ